MSDFFSNLSADFYKSLIKDNRYLYIVDGIKNTLLMALFAVIIGVSIGILIAMIKDTAKRNPKFKFAEMICNAYITIIRGTPVVVQLMIIYYIIFGSVREINMIFVGSLAFGINSGAYVAEIVRAGIESIPNGQMEAGRSLGLSHAQTMRLIILPQAIKNILPALGNEFIVLLKETSIAGYIGIVDLTKAGDIISSRTYDYFFPLIIVAIIYLVIVLGLTKLLNLFERRLKKQ